MRVSAVIAGQCNSDACTNDNFMSVKIEGSAGGSHDPRSQNSAVTWLIDIKLQYSELVTTKAGHNITTTNAMLETVRDKFQEIISGLMAQGVIHIFEAVEIQAKDCHMGACHWCVGKRLLQLFMK